MTSADLESGEGGGLSGIQVAILLAGLGTRLRPHTLTRPKSLLEVAGRPIIEHILEELKSLPVDEILFVYGHLKEQLEEWASNNCSFPYRFVEQRELRGQAHAISLVRDYVDRPLLIIFGDTIFKVDFGQLPGLEADGMLFLSDVDDPQRFGVAVLDDRGFVGRLVEKPREAVSNRAVVGVYYVHDPAALFVAIDEIIAGGKEIGGEFYLADALQAMIDHGARFRASETPVWADCGTIEALLDTSSFLLQHRNAQPLRTPLGREVTVIQPVLIDESATIERSTVGPYATIGPGARIFGSSIRESIIYRDALIENSQLHRSLVGERAVVSGMRGRVNLSDYSETHGE